MAKRLHSYHAWVSPLDVWFDVSVGVIAFSVDVDVGVIALSVDVDVGVIALSVDVDVVIEVIEVEENNKNAQTGKIHFIA